MMIFYEIELWGVPEIRFACSVNVEKSKNRFDYIKDFFELCMIEEGRVRNENFDGTTDVSYPGTLSPVFCDRGCESFSFEGERQRHTTVGVIVSYNLKRYESESECDSENLKKRMREKTIVLIPFGCNLEEYHQKTIDAIKTISFLHLSQNPSDKVKAIGKWYALVAMLTDFVLKKLDKTSTGALPSESAYASKAIDYITSNFNQKISVSDVSVHLGISEGHLHRTFKNAVGMTVLEYINQSRINAALSLMENRGLSFKDASHNVGVDDPAYMSRLFKKTKGISFRAYQKQKEDTLRKLDLPEES